MTSAGPGGEDLVAVHRASTGAAAREYALVLEALSIDHELVQVDAGWVLLVPPASAPHAYEQLRAYEQENARWMLPDDDEPLPLSAGVVAACMYGLALVLVYRLQTTGAFGIDWTRLGRTQAAAIRDGDWWLAATALTLHADPPHLAGNLVFGLVFCATACNLLGVPQGACAILAAGMAGNVLNAWVQTPEHASLGASTAIFGALGILVAHRWRRRRRRRHGALSRNTPLVIGAILLGWLGSSGDVAAHLTGFVSGLLLGAWLGKHARPPEWPTPVRWCLLLAPAGTIVVAWALALRGA